MGDTKKFYGHEWAVEEAKNMLSFFTDPHPGPVGGSRNRMLELRRHMKEYDVTLAELGLTTYKLRSLQRASIRHFAMFYLTKARAADSFQIDHFVELFREETRYSRIDLAEFGTSEAEIDELTRRGIVEYAKSWLNKAKVERGAWDYQNLLKLMYGQMARADLILADIGTSDDEIAEIIHFGRRASATYYLECLRIDRDERKFYDRPHLINKLVIELESGGWTLADIGTDEAEIAGFIQLMVPISAHN